MDTKLTVIVPVYNVSSYLRKCIDSILGQTYKSLEIIIVDDGSTDSSGFLADEIAKEHSSIKVIHQKNGGLSSARNTGINNSRTEYITFVDSDDYIESNMYEDLIHMIDTNNADIVIGGVYRETTSGKKESIYPIGIEKIWNTKEGLIYLNCYKYFNMSFCDKIFRRGLFENDSFDSKGLRFPEGKTSEDMFLMYQVIARANKIVYTSQPYYHYVQRPGSISRSDTIKWDYYDAAKQQMAFYQKWFPDIAYIAETTCVFTHISLYSFYARRGLKCPKEHLKIAKDMAQKYLPSVLKNKFIPKIKVIQAIIFCYATPAYKLIISRITHR